MANVQMIDIQFNDLTYEVQTEYRKTKKQLLKGLDGFFKAGELTAIMGPSGSGKSTLMNILSGFQEGKVKGTIDYIGDDGKHDWSRYKKQSCYIQQMNYLHGFLTTHESMKVAACLKVGNTTEKCRQRIIDDILDNLKLSVAKDTRVEKLSGGQQKRLSIALELVGNPRIIFLDEPTTGLDSTSSSQCITALRMLANTGRTMICTIHQPSATLYQMFDHIYLVADGRYMYAGKPDDSIDYFARLGLQCPKFHNPADYILEVVSWEYGHYDNQLSVAAKKYCQRDRTYSKSCTIGKTNDDEITKVQVKPPSEIKRFWILLYRCILLLHRDWTVVRMKLLLHFFVAILVGLLYEDAGNNANRTHSNFTYLNMSILYITYTTIMPAILKFPLELAILKKERFNNWYQLRTYYIVLLVTGIPIHIISAIIYSTISYTLSGQPLEWFRFMMYLTIMILIGCTAESFGLGFGTIFSPINGTFCGSIYTSINLSLTGIMCYLPHMPKFLFYISYLNYFRYAMDGLVQAMYGYGREKLHCPSQRFYCHYRIPSMFLEELDMSEPMLWLDVGVLFSLFVIVRIIVYISLKRKLSKMC